jgi:heme/copper-type cytochrome/quinol oxidase subunit 1
MGSAAIFIIGACNTFAAAELFPVSGRNTRALAIAQLQYFFVGFGFFYGWAALYSWLARTARLVDEERGAWSFWLMFVGFNLAFFPSSLRASDLPPLPTDALRLLTGNASFEACAGAYTFAAGFLLSVSNIVRALRTAGRL